MRRLAPETNPTLQVAIDYVLANDERGVSIFDIQAHIGMSLDYTKNLMHAASKRLICKPYGSAQLARWHSTSRAAELRAANTSAETVRDRKRAEERRRRAAKLEADYKAAAAADPSLAHTLRDLADTPEVQHVAAGSVPPPFTRAVRSVFDLGAMA